MTLFASLPAATVAAMIATARPRRGKARPVTPAVGFRLRRVRGALIPADQEFSLTADHLYEVPREPQVMPTGILDVDGNMICRIHVPIKQQLGFNTGGNAWTGDCEEEVVLMQTANMIRMSDCGMGIESVDPSELEGEEDDGYD